MSALDLNNIPSANLDQFKKHGGKLIFYHGWIDPGVPPLNTIDYFKKMGQDTKGSQDDFARLFMIPGMGHCGGGPGAQLFDGVTAITDWVENGKKPNGLLATSDATRFPAISRPLCKYPEKTLYVGGDNTLASSYKCVEVESLDDN